MNCKNPIVELETTVKEISPSKEKSEDRKTKLEIQIQEYQMD